MHTAASRQAYPRPPALIVAFILLVGCSVLACRVEADDKRPNIIFLMADDQNTYSMGCYGTPNVQTPNLDRLADDGLIFDRHYVTTAICMGSRANVMTGLLEYRNGCNFDHGPLLRSHWNSSYPVLIRKAGYFTGFAGKFGFEVADQPRGASTLPASEFDRWGGGPGQTSYRTASNPSMKQYADRFPHSTLAYGAFGIDFIRDGVESGKPFCLSISFKAPHRPVQPDPKFDDIYRNATFLKPANFGREFGTHFSKQSKQGRQYKRFHSWNYSSDYDGVMAKYYQQIYAIDQAIGMIRGELSRQKCDRNTVIIYTSDNGFFCGAHGYGSKVLPYEESSRVPLIIYDPRESNSGKKLRCSQLTGNVDFASTILDLAGVSDESTRRDGFSLMQLYRNPGKPIRESLPLINVWGPKAVHSLAVVTRDWKYIQWPYSAEGFHRTEEMYHLVLDPMELKNLAESNRKLDGQQKVQLLKMRGLYDDWVEDWSKKSVTYHNYRPFSATFKRSPKVGTAK